MGCRNSVLFNKKNVGRIYVYSRKFPNMVNEMMLKASLYNMFMSINRRYFKVVLLHLCNIVLLDYQHRSNISVLTAMTLFYDTAKE
jgi:hypothetical protein